MLVLNSSEAALLSDELLLPSHMGPFIPYNSDQAFHSLKEKRILINQHVNPDILPIFKKFNQAQIIMDAFLLDDLNALDSSTPADISLPYGLEHHIRSIPRTARSIYLSPTEHFLGVITHVNDHIMIENLSYEKDNAEAALLTLTLQQWCDPHGVWETQEKEKIFPSTFLDTLNKPLTEPLSLPPGVHHDDAQFLQQFSPPYSARVCIQIEKASLSIVFLTTGKAFMISPTSTGFRDLQNEKISPFNSLSLQKTFQAYLGENHDYMGNDRSAECRTSPRKPYF